MEGSRVELVENMLILGKFYFILFSLNSNGPLIFFFLCYFLLLFKFCELHVTSLTSIQVKL